MDVINLAQDLIKFKTVTPNDDGIMQFLANILGEFGFKSEIVPFTAPGTETVLNLYAKYSSVNSSANSNKTPENFCFLGHVDVVPPGDESLWTSPPFAPEIRDGYLYGRGASDMKCAIAAFVVAAGDFIKTYAGKNNFSISLLITGDEEAISINGTKEMLKYIKNKGEKLDAAIVGEPTNPDRLGEMVKIGRRGSVTFSVTIWGKQGHVAYPHLADNPIKRLNDILYQLSTHKLDQGNEFFDASNLEIVSFDVNNKADNVIPQMANARFNIRFNNEHSADTLIKWVDAICASICEDASAKYEVKTHISGESFITKPGKLSTIVTDSVKEITGITPVLSTTGGTSDARFVKDYCPVVEFGLSNKTAHKIDESANCNEIQQLVLVYKRILENYFCR